MSVLSSQAFDAALRQWLTGSLGRASRRAQVRPARGAGRPPSAVAVICCKWQPSRDVAGLALSSDLTGLLARSTLQDWARQVPASFLGQTPSGTVLLMVPAFSQARATVQALQAFLQVATRALGVDAAAGAWHLRILGPFRSGTPSEVARELAQAGWPLN